MKYSDNVNSALGLLTAGALLSVTMLISVQQNAQAQANEIKLIQDNGTMYVIHMYTSAESRTFNPPQGITEIEYLIVAGGGGGAGGDFSAAGGGGGGGVLVGLTSLTGMVQVEVGAGGAGGIGNGNNGTTLVVPGNGGNSTFGTGLTAIGGGGGGFGRGTDDPNIPPSVGGSGGGGGAQTTSRTTTGAAGTPGQGFAGGDGRGDDSDAAKQNAGGGGGATAPGGDGTTSAGGNGGEGFISSITGVSGVYGSGGGGASRRDASKGVTGGTGGTNAGDGGTGLAGSSAVDGYGGGGGGAGNFFDGGDGGSGIVIIRYAYNSIDAGASVFKADKVVLEENITIGDGMFFTFDAPVIEDNGNTITVESGGMFNNQGGSSPTLTMKRNLEGAEGWRYLTAPTGTTLQNLLAPIWTQGDGITGVDEAFGTPNVYRWGNVTGNDRGSWAAVTDLSQPAITGGEGFLVYVYADPDFDGPETNGFPYELSATGQEFAATVSQTTNSADNASWTLLGNPFATAVDFTTLQSGNAISDAVYVWTPDDTGNTDETDFNSGSWATFTIGSGTEVGDLSSGLIAPFQAFFVQNDGASSVGIDFTNSTKSTGSATTFLFKKQQMPTVRLEVEGSSMKDSAWLTFSENGADHAKTEGDAWELAPMSENYLSLASRKSDGSIFDIGHFSAAADLPKQIPVVVDATQPGEYKLQATDINNFMGNGSLLFKDLERDVTVPIDQDFSYRFDIEKASKISVPSDPFEILNQPFKKENSNSEVRFVIVVNSQLGELSNPDEIPDQIGLKQNFPNPFNPTTQITYELPQNSNVRLQVFDMNGRQVATLVNESVSAGTHTVNFNASDLSSGVYMYRLQAGTTVLTRKLTLIK